MSENSKYPYDMLSFIREQIGDTSGADIAVRMINYTGLINEMSEEAFRFCVGLVYPFLGYRFLKREDVRKADLLEKLQDIVDFLPTRFNASGRDVPKTTKGTGIYEGRQYFKGAGTLDWYLAHIACDSRIKSLYLGPTALRYLKKMEMLTKAVLTKTADPEYIEDVTAIYLSLLRETKAGDREINDLTPGFELQDAELFAEADAHFYKIPGQYLYRYQCYENAYMIFIITLAVFLCRGLQKTGAFCKED